MFLVRNWKLVNRGELWVKYGSVAGNNYIKNQLAVRDGNGGNAENKKARESITNSFQQISGFLLPYPGKRIIEGEFCDHTEGLFASGKTRIKYLIKFFFML